MHMNRLLIDHGASDRRSAIDDVPISSNLPNRDRSKVRGEAPDIAVNAPNYGIIGFTNPGSALDNGIEHRLYVGRRAGDDTQDLARRRLLLQGFLQFLEQADVFKSDDGLVSERFKQLDLSRSEGTNFGATRM